jgi:hypothetical protein
MTTHKEECEKNELILRQRQEIARLTMELARIGKIAFGGTESNKARAKGYAIEKLLDPPFLEKEDGTIEEFPLIKWYNRSRDKESQQKRPNVTRKKMER